MQPTDAQRARMESVKAQIASRRISGRRLGRVSNDVRAAILSLNSDGLSVEGLAEQIGLSCETIHRWKRNKSNAAVNPVEQVLGPQVFAVAPAGPAISHLTESVQLVFGDLVITVATARRA
jgi:hypothetical protein